MKASASALLISAFPSGLQKGPKVSKKRGEAPESETRQQHGELANSEAPKAVESSKPKMMNHSSKAMLPRYAGMGETKKVSPREEVQRDAHSAKVSATRMWIDGHISTAEHDARHRRADAVLKHKGMRP